MIYSVPESFRNSCEKGISAYEKAGMNFMSHADYSLAKNIARGGKIHADDVALLAQWWAHNSKSLNEDESSPLGVHALIKGGRVGREWLANTYREILARKEQAAWVKGFGESGDAGEDYLVSVRWLPFFGRDEDGNWYSEKTRVHKEGELTPGVLDMHGFYYGGDAKSAGQIIGIWSNALGKNFDIKLDRSHPQFEAYVKAAKDKKLMCSPGFIPGYYKEDKKTRFISDLAPGEISLIVLDETQHAKHPGAIGVPYSERDLLNSVRTLPGANEFIKASCSTCKTPNMVSLERAEQLFKSCGINYMPPFKPPSASGLENTNQGREKGAKKMSAKDMLKGVIKGVAGEGRITDILNRVVDALAGDELQELSDGNMDELIKAIEEKSGVENMIKAVGFDELSDDDKKVAVAVLLKAARGAGAVIPDVEGITKQLADANAQIASLNEQMQKRESEFQGKEDEGWFNALIKAGKADPVEREAAMASLAEARKADALVKGGTSAMVKVIKATYDARVPQSDTKLADDAVEKLVKAGKVVSHNTQAGKEEEALKKRIAQETNSMLSASPEGRQAMATKNAEA